MYLESWLSDIYDVLDLRTHHGKGKQRMRDLFYGLCIMEVMARIAGVASGP